MRHPSIEFDFSAGGCILGALMILVLPNQLCISILIAAMIHECCHIGVFYLCRIPIYEIRIKAGGAEILCGPMTDLQEFLCALAGPLGSLLCVFSFHRFPYFALCAFVQGIFNLLPIYPLDGGRILCCIVHAISAKYCNIICYGAKYLTILSILALCILGYIKTGLYLFLILPLFFVFKTQPFRKTPCNEA